MTWRQLKSSIFDKKYTILSSSNCPKNHNLCTSHILNNPNDDCSIPNPKVLKQLSDDRYKWIIALRLSFNMYCIFLWPLERAKFFGQFFMFSSLCSLWKISFRIAMNFFSGHFRGEGGRFISQKPLKQVFSAPSLSGFP